MRYSLAIVLTLCAVMSSSCGTTWFSPPGETLPATRVQPAGPNIAAAIEPEKTPAYGWSIRIVTEDELSRVTELHPDLTPPICKRILARMNARAHYYISEDIRDGKQLKAPDDFAAWRHWSPLPREVMKLAATGKSILVVKDLPFVGWYESGLLVADSYACVGKEGELTRSGNFRVLEMDPDHVSRSYPNEFGRPASMPWAMRIYDTVWIHAGDIWAAQCSHGCVSLPMEEAEELYRWAAPGTSVLIVDSIREI